MKDSENILKGVCNLIMILLGIILFINACSLGK